MVTLLDTPPRMFIVSVDNVDIGPGMGPEARQLTGPELHKRVLRGCGRGSVV